MSPFLYSGRPGRKLNKNGLVILFESTQKSKFKIHVYRTRYAHFTNLWKVSLCHMVRFKRFPRMQFKYYENYKIIRLILITWLVSVSRRHQFALYKKRARQTFGKEDKIVWILFCFKFLHE